jgi:hypothetical protein
MFQTLSGLLDPTVAYLQTDGKDVFDDFRAVHPTTAHWCTLGTPKIGDFSNRFENSKNFPDYREYSRYREDHILSLKLWC